GFIPPGGLGRRPQQQPPAGKGRWQDARADSRPAVPTRGLNARSQCRGGESEGMMMMRLSEDFSHSESTASATATAAAMIPGGHHLPLSYEGYGGGGSGGMAYDQRGTASSYVSRSAAAPAGGSGGGGGGGGGSGGEPFAHAHDERLQRGGG
ncbi:unnamed protein product, partial [Ectocarpus fasciculatus]